MSERVRSVPNEFNGSILGTHPVLALKGAKRSNPFLRRVGRLSPAVPSLAVVPELGDDVP